MARWVAAGVLVALFAAIYVPALGRGFMKDDFRWMAAADVRSPSDVGRIFTSNVGFYRPLVTASFAVDRALWGLDPRGYALTNTLLLAADAALLFLLAIRLSLPVPAALFAVAVWAFNFHGINMALLWISGRTTLLLCLFAQASVLAALAKRPVAAALLALCAMLCKEEAVLLPLILFVNGVRRHESPRVMGSDPGDGATQKVESIRIRGLTPSVFSGVFCAVLAIYAALRVHSGAFGFSDAPDYYRLTFAPAVVLQNVIQYLDRGATVAVVAAAAMWMAAPGGRLLDDRARHIFTFGALWFVTFYAITVFVPYRSSLYAVVPSIGSALAAATFAARAWRDAPRRFARVTMVMMATIAMLMPVYRSRNHGFVEPQALAMQTLATLQDESRRHHSTRDLVLVNDPSSPVTLDDAFGALLPDATRLFVGREWRARVVQAE